MNDNMKMRVVDRGVIVHIFRASLDGVLVVKIETTSKYTLEDPNLRLYLDDRCLFENPKYNCESHETI